jgi:hypothetical protein
MSSSAVILVVACSTGYALAASAGAAPPFKDVTQQMGLHGLSARMSASWVDYDQDGYVDLYADGQLWHNLKGKRFELVKGTPLVGYGIWADYDNDGYPDLFTFDAAKSAFHVYHNLAGKKFEDIGSRFPTLPIQSSLGAAWGDFDNDGFVDLYVGGYEKEHGGNYPSVLVHNNGDGSLAITWTTPDKQRPQRGITAADYDEDGDLDIYVSNYRLEANYLWQNDGKGHFKDVAQETGTAGTERLGCYGHTIGSSWGDLDNDGHLDLFVGNFAHPPSYQDRSKFLKNLGPAGQFKFKDMSVSAGLKWQESFATPTLGDFDNDGKLDLFFATVYSGDHSVLYRNMGNWHFEDVTAASGITSAITYEAAWADYDNDGYLDLVTQGKLYHNPGGSNHWLKVKLIGSGKVNRSAIGAQARIHLGDQTLTRQVESATGEDNENDMTLHFGLGGQAEPVQVMIRWPDGKEQAVTTSVDKLVSIIHP